MKMISDQEFLEIIKGLHENTAGKKLDWKLENRTGYAAAAYQRQPNNVGGYAPTAYERQPLDAYWVRLPKSVIELQYGSPSAEPDFIVFTIARELGGQALASRKVYEGDFGWEPLSTLYALIKRRDLGWDDVFSSVREFLANPVPPATSPKGP
jgi:hypothetical protein